MKKLALLATVAALGMSAQANAVDFITSARVTGPSGTVWDTTQNGFYTLFISTGTFTPPVNGNDEAINLSVADNGVSRFLTNGEGFRIGETDNSDLIYTLTLDFASGNTLTGLYTTTGGIFSGGTSFTDEGVTYSLTEFSYERQLGDRVNQFVATPGGDGNDYVGNFTVNAVAVPEPAAWAMMIVGVGAVGGSMRVRRRNAKISFA